MFLFDFVIFDCKCASRCETAAHTITLIRMLYRACHAIFADRRKKALRVRKAFPQHYVYGKPFFAPILTLPNDFICFPEGSAAGKGESEFPRRSAISQTIVETNFRTNAAHVRAVLIACACKAFGRC